MGLVVRIFITVYLLLLTYSPLSAAEDNQQMVRLHQQPAISIIIDDLGDQLRAGLRAVILPGDVTFSILPQTPYAHRLATLAHKQGRQIMLHLPMESIDHHDLGNGGLTLDMTHDIFVKTLLDSLASIPYVTGINNHMGSLLTQHPGHMQWLMEEISHHGHMFFIDSQTTTNSVAYRLAVKSGVPSLKRDVFLDNDRDPEAIAARFEQLLEIARNRGTALAIGHPHPETLAYLEQQLPLLEEQGIKLVSASELIQYKLSTPLTRTAMKNNTAPLASASQHSSSTDTDASALAALSPSNFVPDRPQSLESSNRLDIAPSPSSSPGTPSEKHPETLVTKSDEQYGLATETTKTENPLQEETLN